MKICKRATCGFQTLWSILQVLTVPTVIASSFLPWPHIMWPASNGCNTESSTNKFTSSQVHLFTVCELARMTHFSHKALDSLCSPEYSLLVMHCAWSAGVKQTGCSRINVNTTYI